MERFTRLHALCRLISAVSLLPVILLGEEEPPLPTWNRDIPAGSTVPGGNFSQLLPENQESVSNDPFYLGNPLLKPQPLLTDDASGLSPHDLSLFLRGGLLSVHQEAPQQSPTPTLVLRELPEHVRASLSQVPLNEHLIDPQSLITEVPAQDLARLLQFHADESRILMYILVLERDQKLSSVTQIRSLTERLSGKRDVCLAVYPLGEPWRVRLLVSPQLQQNCPVNALTEMAEDCIADALLTHDAERQLQRFAVKLSTRLFQLEKNLPQVSIPVAVTSPGLHEVGRKGPAIEISQAREAVSPMVAVAVSFLTVLAIGCLVYVLRAWRRFRKTRKTSFVWILPENETHPRLGGAFSGGTGSSVSYGRKGMSR